MVIFRLFVALGMVFSFVESDVTAKSTILRELYAADPENYATVGKMVNLNYCWSVVPDLNSKFRFCQGVKIFPPILLKLKKRRQNNWQNTS